MSAAGTFSFEPVDAVPKLTDDEEAEIQVAIESVRVGKGVDLEVTKARVDRILGR